MDEPNSDTASTSMLVVNVGDVMCVMTHGDQTWDPPYGGSDGDPWHILLGPPRGTLFTV